MRMLAIMVLGLLVVGCGSERSMPAKEPRPTLSFQNWAGKTQQFSRGRLQNSQTIRVTWGNHGCGFQPPLSVWCRMIGFQTG